MASVVYRSEVLVDVECGETLSPPCITGDGRRAVVVANPYGIMHVLDIRTRRMREAVRVEGIDRSVYSISPVSGARVALELCMNIAIVDTDNGRIERRIATVPSPIRALCAAGGERVASLHYDGIIRVWETATGGKVGEGDERVTAMCLMEEKGALAFVDEKGTLHLPDGREVQDACRPAMHHRLCCAGDVVCCSTDGICCAVDVRAKRVISSFRGWRVAPLGKGRVLVECRERTHGASVVDVATGEVVAEVREEVIDAAGGGDGGEAAVVTTEDGRLLLVLPCAA